ncbi:hypothetical protein OPV22_004980 [Ensete ventricosum]|uniref:Uncharacterized protein n=1 Tax=Ensete ventricosum TaxID=4639 RepID=A0AAV8RQ20_ENSVE|nr:hypothetical protein OPV22_004980 [Ensete ventricosum]
MGAYTKKEKCLLEICSMTQRVWSLVEKEVDRQVENLIGKCTYLTKDLKQELDDLCYELGWTLPQHRILPSILDGRVKDVNFRNVPSNCDP